MIKNSTNLLFEIFPCLKGTLLIASLFTSCLLYSKSVASAWSLFDFHVESNSYHLSVVHVGNSGCLKDAIFGNIPITNLVISYFWKKKHFLHVKIVEKQTIH